MDTHPAMPQLLSENLLRHRQSLWPACLPHVRWPPDISQDHRPPLHNKKMISPQLKHTCECHCKYSHCKYHPSAHRLVQRQSPRLLLCNPHTYHAAALPWHPASLLSVWFSLFLSAHGLECLSFPSLPSVHGL